MSDNNIDLNTPERIRERIEANMLLKILEQIDLLKDHPRMQIFITHGFLELIMEALIKSRAKNGKRITSDNRSYPYSAKILILNEIGVIDNNKYRVLEWFRKIRNKAAHDPLFNLKSSELTVLKEKKWHNTDEFSNLCSHLIFMVWSDNYDVLGPLFTPTLVNIGDN